MIPEDELDTSQGEQPPLDDRQIASIADGVGSTSPSMDMDILDYLGQTNQAEVIDELNTPQEDPSEIAAVDPRLNSVDEYDNLSNNDSPNTNNLININSDTYNKFVIKKLWQKISIDLTKVHLLDNRTPKISTRLNRTVQSSLTQLIKYIRRIFK